MIICDNSDTPLALLSRTEGVHLEHGAWLLCTLQRVLYSQGIHLIIFLETKVFLSCAKTKVHRNIGIGTSMYERRVCRSK